jgi:hypothetical protein
MVSEAVTPNSWIFLQKLLEGDFLLIVRFHATEICSLLAQQATAVQEGGRLALEAIREILKLTTCYASHAFCKPKGWQSLPPMAFFTLKHV